MIIGFSHFTISSRNLKASIERLNRLGYEILFKDTAVENSIHKKPYLSKHHPKHDLVFMTCRDAASVELIDHHTHSSAQQSNILLICRGTAPLDDWVKIDRNEMNISKKGAFDFAKTYGQQLCVFYDPVLDLQFAYIEPFENEPLGFISAIIFTNDIQNAEDKLQKLRFSEGKYPGLWFLPAPFNSMSISLTLTENKFTDTLRPCSYLDAPGCCSLAFLTRDISANYGIEQRTPEVNLDVNNSDLTIKFLISSELPIIEVIKK